VPRGNAGLSIALCCVTDKGLHVVDHSVQDKKISHRRLGPLHGSLFPFLAF